MLGTVSSSRGVGVVPSTARGELLGGPCAVLQEGHAVVINRAVKEDPGRHGTGRGRKRAGGEPSRPERAAVLSPQRMGRLLYEAERGARDPGGARRRRARVSAAAGREPQGADWPTAADRRMNGWTDECNGRSWVKAEAHRGPAGGGEQKRGRMEGGRAGWTGRPMDTIGLGSRRRSRSVPRVQMQEPPCRGCELLRSGLGRSVRRGVC